jgi:minor tail protein
MSVTGFEIGAIFKIVDEATGPLRRIMESVRELNKEIKVAREGMAGFGAAVAPGIAAAIADVNLLAGAWGRVEAATLAATRASATTARAAAASAVGGGASVRHAAVGLGGGSGSLGRPSSSMPHVSGPGISLPGGSHARFGGTPAMVAAAVGAFSIYEAANLEYDVMQMKYHLGIDAKDHSRDAEIGKALTDGMESTGYDLPQVAEAATDMARLMRDTPGFDVMKELPRFLRAAQAETLSKGKGTTLDSAMGSIIGLAHMSQEYRPGEIEKLFQIFAYASTANPASLPAMEKTLSYAVPSLHAGADMDTKDLILLSTVLSTSGVTSSKGGTWLRSLGQRLMPGDDSTKAGHKHNEMLKRLGLLDKNGKPSWYVNGKPDIPRAMEIAGPRARAMSPEERLPLEHEVFGERGAGAFAILGSDPALQRYRDLRAGMDNPANIARYNDYVGNAMSTTKGMARSTIQEFNVAMIELGTTGLPLATAGIKGLSAALGWITGGHQTQEDKTFKPSWMEKLHDYIQPFAFGDPRGGASSLPKLQNQSWTGEQMHAQPMNFLQGPSKPQSEQFAFSLNVDGDRLAQAVIDKIEAKYGFPTGAAGADTLHHWVSGDHGGIGA